MDSRDIAELTGKMHKHVVRDIACMIEKSQSKNGLSYIIKSYKSANGVNATYYLLDYEMTMLLLTGYSVELRQAVVHRWLELEEEYSKKRTKSIEVRNTFTDTLKGHGYKKNYEYIQTTMQMKQKLNIEHKKNEMSAKELKAIFTAESLAELMIDDEQGYSEVNPVCVNASQIVQNAISSKKLIANI